MVNAHDVFESQFISMMIPGNDEWIASIFDHYNFAMALKIVLKLPYFYSLHVIIYKPTHPQYAMDYLLSGVLLDKKWP